MREGELDLFDELVFRVDEERIARPEQHLVHLVTVEEDRLPERPIFKELRRQLEAIVKVRMAPRDADVALFDERLDVRARDAFQPVNPRIRLETVRHFFAEVWVVRVLVELVPRHFQFDVRHPDPYLLECVENFSRVPEWRELPCIDETFRLTLERRRRLAHVRDHRVQDEERLRRL